MMPIIVFVIAAAVYSPGSDEATIYTFKKSFNSIEVCEASRPAVIEDLQQQIGAEGFVLDSACISHKEQAI
jgi:hypothetical protein